MNTLTRADLDLACHLAHTAANLLVKADSVHNNAGLKLAELLMQRATEVVTPSVTISIPRDTNALRSLLERSEADVAAGRTMTKSQLLDSFDHQSQTDKLTQLTASVAKLLDGALALPGDTDRELAARELADALMDAAIVLIPDAVEHYPLTIAGFTIGYCDDGSAYLEADNRPGEEGVSVRIDHLSKALSDLYVAASQ